MPNISSIVKNVRNIMRQDRGVYGDAQRLEQLRDSLPPKLISGELRLPPGEQLTKKALNV